MNAFAYEMRYAEHEDEGRNFLVEAILIAKGESRLIPQREHVESLYASLTNLERSLIHNGRSE